MTANHPKHRVFLGLGSNLGYREWRLRTAVKGLAGVAGVSPVYETEPIGGPEGQPAYLNCVVELSTRLAPEKVLAVCRRLEDAAGRLRVPGEQFAPRTLDVDVLLYDDLTIDTPDLTVPHPRMFRRRFVMAPLVDLAPDVVPAGWEETAEGNVRRVGKLFP